MALRFEIKKRDALGRIGRLECGPRFAETPLLMPVINPNIRLIDPGRLYDMGYKALITNAYILLKNAERGRGPGGDIHEHLDFPGIIMTDSGTFQSHVYGKVDVNNRDIVQFQRAMGSDIGTVLDLFTEPGDTMAEAEGKAALTKERIEEGIRFKGDMALNAPIQGGVYPGLRESTAAFLAALDCDYHAIGGVVPIMEDYGYRTIAEIILAVRQEVNDSRPLHLFGCGHPMLFPMAVALGIDVFDSASYAKYAANGRLMFPWGTAHLEELEDIPCNCPVCSKVKGSAEVLDMEKEERTEAIALHNLWQCMVEIKRIKENIGNGTLWEMVEARAHCHPSLMEALLFLKERLPDLWRFGTLGKKRLFYTGDLTMARPEVIVYRKRVLERYSPTSDTVLVLSPGRRPFSAHLDYVLDNMPPGNSLDLLVASEIGAVPLELDHLYPNAQAIFPQGICPPSSRPHLNDFLEKKSYRKVVDGRQKAREEIIKAVKKISVDQGSGQGFDMDLRRARAAADMGFGRGAGKVLFPAGKGVEYVKSRKTGRIRNVLYKGVHLASFDASTGRMFLRPEGARRLHKGDIRDHAVEVNEDSAEFNKKGRNVFSGFVESVGPGLLWGDEVYVYSKDSGVVATGRSLMNSSNVKWFDHGVAVKVRFGSEE